MLTLLGLLLAGQAATGPTQSPPTIAGAEVDLVRVDAVVTDKADRRVEGLGVDDFELAPARECRSAGRTVDRLLGYGKLTAIRSLSVP